MSLYYEAADLIKSLGGSQDTSLKSLLFSRTKTNDVQTRKSNPAQLYALITEAWKWTSILKDVIERSGLLTVEKKLTPQLALVLVHDLLLAKKGIAAPENHGVRQAVERHKARLRAEFTKARIKSGCASVEELRKLLEGQNRASSSNRLNGVSEGRYQHPRWLRINSLKEFNLDGEETKHWKPVETLSEVLAANSTTEDSLVYYVDNHIPNLLALPPRTDLSTIPAYKRGELISQDKASCFPAYLLSSGDRLQGNILDACAAPGNKTSHIAAIVSEQTKTKKARFNRVFATERDRRRADVLARMLSIAGADEVEVHAGQDFLKLNPSRPPWDQVTAIILDPSCSGSGIVDRGQIMTFDLPSVYASNSIPNGSNHSNKNRSKKRKRENHAVDSQPTQSKETIAVEVNENDVDMKETAAKDLEVRLKALAALQTKMLTFAFTFPQAQRITYSTCSIHDTENEAVVVTALTSEIAKGLGWRILRRGEQIDGMKAWHMRGKESACQAALVDPDSQDLDIKDIAEACIRCEPFTEEGTQGFFVAGFVRDELPIHKTPQQMEDDEYEWGGFDD